MAKILCPILLGALLIGAGAAWNEKTSAQEKAVAHYNEALAALDQADFDGAIALFTESALYAQDPNLRAAALHNAATIAWFAKLGSYEALVGTYKEALRSNPDLKEASFNLELLYWLKANGQAPGQGDDGTGQGQQGGKGVPGGRP